MYYSIHVAKQENEHSASPSTLGATAHPAPASSPIPLAILILSAIELIFSFQHTRNKQNYVNSFC